VALRLLDFVAVQLAAKPYSARVTRYQRAPDLWILMGFMGYDFYGWVC
jgi:hypothetical protein